MDAVLTYSTPKLVCFEDRRIALLRLGLVAGILAYVGVYQFAMQGAWAESRPIAGSSRLTLRQPTVNSCDPAAAGCSNTFRNKSSLPYCAEFAPRGIGATAACAGSIFPCEFFAAPLPVGADLNGAALAVTKLRSVSQINVCAASADNCPHIFVAQEGALGDGSVYVADMESFTVALDHTAWTTASQLGGSTTDEGYVTVAARQKHGKVYVPKNDVLCASLEGHKTLETSEPHLAAPCFILPNTTSSNMDFFRLDVLLLAAAAESTLRCPLDKINYDGKVPLALSLSRIHRHSIHVHSPRKPVHSCTREREHMHTCIRTCKHAKKHADSHIFETPTLVLFWKVESNELVFEELVYQIISTNKTRTLAQVQSILC